MALQPTSDISCVVKADLLQLTACKLRASPVTCWEAVSLKYQIGGKDSCSSLQSLPHWAVIYEVVYNFWNKHIAQFKAQNVINMIFCNPEAVSILLYQCTDVSGLCFWSADFLTECYPEHHCVACISLICFINCKNSKLMILLTAA